MLIPSSRTILRQFPRSLASSNPSTKLLRYPRRRCQSTSAPSGSHSSSKISTIPFHFTKEEAEPWLKIGALSAAASLPNFIYSLFIRYFGERFTWLLREFGLAGEGLTHLQTKAVLYPFWRYHLVLKGKVKPLRETIDGKKTTVGDGVIMIDGSSLSGNAFSPLCLLSYAVGTLPSSLPTYDPTIHLKQLGDLETINPVPFTVQPWTLLESLREKLGDDVRWDDVEGVVDAKKDWREVMLAAYPIMAPIYIAEYSYKSEDKPTPRRITVVMDGSQEIENTRVSFPRPAWSRQKGLEPTYWWNNPPPLNSFGFFLSSFPSLQNAEKSDAFSNLMQSLLRFLDPLHPCKFDKDGKVIEIQDPPASPLLEGDVGEEGIAWDDERIQSWNGDERKQNEAWFEVFREREDLKGTLETVVAIRAAGRRAGQEVELGLDDNNTDNSQDKRVLTFTQVRNGLTNKLRTFDEDVKTLKPSWLTRYEEKVAKDAREKRRKEVEAEKEKRMR